MKQQINLEQKSEEENKKKRMILLILCILTILMGVVGASFAFFSSSLQNYQNESLILNTANLEGATYQSSKTIALKDAFPGDYEETNFTITNPNKTARIRYTLKFVSDINNFSKDDGLGQLLITISGKELENDIVLDFTDKETKEGIIITDIELNPEQSDDYKLRLDFKDIGVSQNSNIKKTFAGHIEISETIAVQ